MWIICLTNFVKNTYLETLLCNMARVGVPYTAYHSVFLPMTNINIHYKCRLSSYLKENTMCFHWIDLSMSDVQANNDGTCI